MLSRKNIFIVFLYLFSFFLIYNPSVFFNFNSIYILTIVSLLIILLTKNSINSFFSNKRLLLFTVFNIFYLIYALFIDISEDSKRWYTFFITYLGVINSYAFVLVFRKVYEYDFDKLIEFLIRLGLIQVTFVILSVLIPEFREWTLSSARDTDLVSISNDFGAIRSFGLSGNYTSGLPMLMGVLSLFSLYLLINENKIKYKLYYGSTLLLFLFTVALNARVGFLPLIVFLFLYPLSFFGNLKNIVTFLGMIFLCLISYFFLWDTILSNKYFERIKMGYEEIEKLFEGEKTGNIEVLSEMFFIPSDFNSFFWGEGVDVFGGFKLSSDIGFVRDLYMLGFLYIALFFLAFYFLMKPYLFYSKNKFGSVFIIIMIFSLFLYYWKGMIYSSTEIYNLIFILSIFCCFKYSFKSN